jgi:cytoskeletal protein CcmA (bactofilin family)
VGLFSSRDRGGKDPNNLTRETAKPAQPGSADTHRTDSRLKSPASSIADTSPGNPSSDFASGEPSESQSMNRESTAGQTGSRQTDTSTSSEGKKRMATIGQSIVFKGELNGDEDLEIEGQVNGHVELTNHQLTIGPNGRLKAEVNAKSIVVIGQVIGNLTASERIEVQATGVVQGDLKAPRLNVQEGAVLNGGIEMTSSSSTEAKKPASPNAEAPGNPPADSLKSA